MGWGKVNSSIYSIDITVETKTIDVLLSSGLNNLSDYKFIQKSFDEWSMICFLHTLWTIAEYNYSMFMLELSKFGIGKTFNLLKLIKGKKEPLSATGARILQLETSKIG